MEKEYEIIWTDHALEDLLKLLNILRKIYRKGS